MRLDGGVKNELRVCSINQPIATPLQSSFHLCQSVCWFTALRLVRLVWLEPAFWLEVKAFTETCWAVRMIWKPFLSPQCVSVVEQWKYWRIYSTCDWLEIAGYCSQSSGVNRTYHIIDMIEENNPGFFHLGACFYRFRFKSKICPEWSGAMEHFISIQVI